MNRSTYFILFALLTCCTSLNAQQETGQGIDIKEFILVDRIDRPESSTSAPVLDHDGQIVGQCTPAVTDTLVRYNLQFDNGKSATVDALTHSLYNPVADRLLVYGSSLFSHVNSKARVVLYDGTGRQIKDLGVVAYFPFEVAMAGNGDFYVAGKKLYEQAVFELKKFDAGGNLLWAKNLPFGMPAELTVSGSGRRIGLALDDQDRMKTTIYYFDDSGNTLAQNTDFGMMANLEFLGDEKVIVCTGRQFYLYQIVGQALISYAQFPGNAIGQHPVTVYPSGDGFVVTSVENPVAQSGYRVRAYNENGVLTREMTFTGVPTFQAARLVVFQAADVFSLRLPQESVILKLEK